MEAEHVYDRSLRELRLPHYQRLFHLTRVMPREWLLSTIPCKVDVISIRESLRDWYFGEESGGMFLSQPARDRYFDLYDELESAIAGLDDDAESLSREGAAELRQRASALRHQLVADLGVAERPRTRVDHAGKRRRDRCRHPPGRFWRVSRPARESSSAE